MKTQFEIDYAELLYKYKNNEWRNLKEKHEWKIRLEVMEEIDETLKKERIKKEMLEKYFSDNIE